MKTQSIKRMLGILEKDSEYEDFLNKWMQYRETLEELGDSKAAKYCHQIHEKIFGNVDKDNTKYQEARSESIRIWEKIYGDARGDI